MAISFPLNASQFFKDLPIVNVGLQLSDERASHSNRGGELIISESGDRLWQGEVVLDTQEASAAARFVALAELLGEAGASFLASVEHVSPSVTGITPTLAGVRNGNELKLGDLPQGATFRPGDYISFEYGADPKRYALHRIADLVDAVAGVGGETNYVRVIPHIQPGYTLGVTVKTADPLCKAVMEPGSLRAPTYEGIWAKGWSFRWRQSNR